jgi:hypothetical protein
MNLIKQQNDIESVMSELLTKGRYRHYKGQEYEVFNTARHSESDELLVVYRCLYDDYSWWVRPFSMFTETVSVDGKIYPRFEYIGEHD